SRQDRTRAPRPLAVCNRSGNAIYGRRNRLPPPFRNREILPLLVKAKRTGKVPQKFWIRPKNAQILVTKSAGPTLPSRLTRAERTAIVYGKSARFHSEVTCPNYLNPSV